MTTTGIATANDAAFRVEIDATTDVAVTAWQLSRTYQGVTETVRGDATATTFTASGTSRTLFDVEAPRGLPITYVVGAVKADGTMELSQPIGPVTLDESGDCWWWAAPISLPRLGVRFEPDRQDDQIYAAANGVFRATGRTDPIVLFGTRQTATGSLFARCETYADADTLRTTIGGPDVIVLRAPADVGWSLSGRRYVALDTIAYARLRPEEIYSSFTVALPWIDVLPPNMAVIGWGAVWDDVDPVYATWIDLQAPFPVWDDLIAWVP